MNKISFLHWAPRVALCLAGLGLNGATLAQSGGRKPAPPVPAPAEIVVPQKPLTEQARESLSEGRAVQALALARRAAQEDPGDYKAEYYAAFALMELGETAEATKAVERSFNLARTPEAKAAVDELRASLNAQGALKEADAAAAEGLHAKAGRLYLQAWQKGALPPEKTLLAADLFQQRLKDSVTAARMLRDLPARHVGTPVAEEATRRLIALRPALAEVADAALAQARELEPENPERARWLQNVLDSDADNQTAQLMLANDAAEAGNWDVLESQLKLLQRKGWLQALLESKSLSFGKWQSDAKLRTLLTDIWGDKRGAELLALNTTDSQPLTEKAATARALRRQALNTAAFEAAGLKAGTGVAFRDCSQCPELVWLPPGTLPRRDPTAPLAAWLNNVRIGYPLAVGKYEVTFAEWDLCAAEGACRQQVPEGATPGVLFDSKWGRGRQPVVNVHWDDARAYVQWLSKKTGENYRLMSLAEFTYAARAGRADGALSASGANCMTCTGTAGDRTIPVGSFAANAWGLHDMIGNVKEMATDCSFKTSTASLPTDGAPMRTGCTHRVEQFRSVLGEDLVAMGGSWLDVARDGVLIGNGFERQGDTFTGFRVARTFKPKSK